MGPQWGSSPHRWVSPCPPKILGALGVGWRRRFYGVTWGQRERLGAEITPDRKIIPGAKRRGRPVGLRAAP